MNITDVIITHILDSDEADHLNDFLALGWRILEVRKNRKQDGEGFYEEFGYLIGAPNLLEFPDRYRKKLEANRKLIESGGF